MGASSIKSRARGKSSRAWHKHFVERHNREPTREEGLIFGTGFNAGFSQAIKKRKINNAKDEDICKCGHHTNDHSYLPDYLENGDLHCDKCDCSKFRKCEGGE